MNSNRSSLTETCGAWRMLEMFWRDTLSFGKFSSMFYNLHSSFNCLSFHLVILEIDFLVVSDRGE